MVLEALFCLESEVNAHLDSVCICPSIIPRGLELDFIRADNWQSLKVLKITLVVPIFISLIIKGDEICYINLGLTNLVIHCISDYHVYMQT